MFMRVIPLLETKQSNNKWYNADRVAVIGQFIGLLQIPYRYKNWYNSPASLNEKIFKVLIRKLQS